MSRSFLGVELYKPRVAFFDFTGCEGCQLQVINNEATLLEFLSLVDIRKFREAMTGGTDDYEIAFIEGSITRADEVERLEAIRRQAKVLVALGSCACFGGVNQLKNRFASDLGWTVREVYGDFQVDSGAVRAVGDVVKVDMMVLGCPISKPELERITLAVALGRPVEMPRYPVCMECKEAGNICMFDLGEPCLGPVTRAGCGAWCTSNRASCRGCRGPSDEPNMELMAEVMRTHGFPEERFMDMLACFGGFQKYTKVAHEA